MTTELKITHTSGNHAVLVKMLRGFAVAHEQIIEPGQDGSVLVHAGQTVSIEEVEGEYIAPVPVGEVVAIDTNPDALPPEPDAPVEPVINTMESMNASITDATPVIETVTYPDETVATGVEPLPQDSPSDEQSHVDETPQDPVTHY